MLQKEQITHICMLGVAVITIFLTGFYIGARANTKTETTYVPFSSSSDDEVVVEAQQVPGVSWIHPGSQPTCPETHAIKGAYSNDHGKYYTRDNKQYARIKPDICFATEEFARDTAGYIKKF